MILNWLQATNFSQMKGLLSKSRFSHCNRKSRSSRNRSWKWLLNLHSFKLNRLLVRQRLLSSRSSRGIRQRRCRSSSWSFKPHKVTFSVNALTCRPNRSIWQRWLQIFKPSEMKRRHYELSLRRWWMIIRKPWWKSNAKSKSNKKWRRR
jgi:hypothetical protein